MRFPLALRKLHAIKSLTLLFASEIGRCVEDTARVMVSPTARQVSALPFWRFVRQITLNVPLETQFWELDTQKEKAR